MKEYDQFKDLIIDCLDQIFKKLPKKVKKTFESDLLNKNRTDRC
jgi:hypothetical protein